MGYSPWDRKESDTTERLQFQFSMKRYMYPSVYRSVNYNYQDVDGS